MNGSAIPITRVLSSKIVDDGPLILAEINATNLNVSTLLKADHIAEKTTSHGITIDQVLNVPAGLPASLIKEPLCLAAAGGYLPPVLAAGTTTVLWEQAAEVESTIQNNNHKVVGLITVPPHIPAGSVVTVRCEIHGTGGSANLYFAEYDTMPALNATVDATGIFSTPTIQDLTGAYVAKQINITLPTKKNIALLLDWGSGTGPAYLKNVIISSNITYPTVELFLKWAGSS